MGSVNYGNQYITLDFYAPATSDNINKRHHDIRVRGIYSGGYLTKVDDTTVTLSPLLCEIGDDERQVRVQTTTDVMITVSSSTPYIILRWAYTGAVNNYMDVLAVASGDIQDNDLIVGKCVFSGSTLTGFNYEDRSTPLAFDLWLKVEPTNPASMKVRIRPGYVNYGSQSYFIVDQESPTFSAPGSGSRIDLVYVDTDGTVKIKQGTASANPSPPDYEGKVVLAEITLTAGQTSITESDIKDVRAFVSGSLNTFLKLSDTPNSYSGQAGKVVQVNDSEDALVFGDMSSHVVILTGEINHGGTIPLPEGFTQDQCKWIVSIRDVGDDPNSIVKLQGIECYADSNRVVTCRANRCYTHNSSTDHYGWSGCVANYLIIGVK